MAEELKKLGWYHIRQSKKFDDRCIPLEQYDNVSDWQTDRNDKTISRSACDKNAIIHNVFVYGKKCVKYLHTVDSVGCSKHLQPN